MRVGSGRPDAAVRPGGDPFPDGIGQVFGAGDFDGDGDVDLYTTVGVFLNTRGFFAPGPTMPAGFVATTNIRAILVAEATGDGRPDVLGGGGGGGTTTPPGLWLFVAPPSSGTQFTISASAFSGANLMTRVCAADVDGDGDTDVIGASTSTANPQWQLFLNNGTGTFAAAPPAQWPSVPIAASWIAAGDFDGDGLIDAFATGTPGNAVWRKNLGGGNFGPAVSIGSSPPRRRRCRRRLRRGRGRRRVRSRHLRQRGRPQRVARRPLPDLRRSAGSSGLRRSGSTSKEMATWT